MIKNIVNKITQTIIKISLSFIMLIALFYLRFYETNPYYKPKRL